MSSLRNPFYAEPPQEPPPRSSFGVHTGDPERPVRSSSRGVWLAVILLAGAVGAMWYSGQNSLDAQNAQLAQIPSLREASDSLTKVVDSARNEINSWASETDKLRKRFNEMESAVSQKLKVVQVHARELVDQLGAQIRAETDAKTSALETRLNTLETQQSAQHTRLTEVEQKVQEEVSLLRTDTQKEVGGLAQRISGNDRQVELLDARTTPQRVDFQLPRGRAVEMVPGISVVVRKVHVSGQRFDARVNLLEEKHYLSVEGHSAYQPVRFYSKKSRQPYEFVVTDVGKEFVVGYVILPARVAELRADSSPTDARAEKAAPTPEKP